MDRITEALLSRKKELEKAIAVAEACLKGAPEGRLKISSTHGKEQYHLIRSNEIENSITKYLSKSNQELVNQLAQRDYTHSFLRAAHAELKAIDSLLHKGVLFSSDSTYSRLSSCRKKLVKPFMIDDDTYASLWEKKPFDPNPNPPENKKFCTERGEMVRSKSEMIFANMFYDMGIPYKYECPIKFKSGLIYHPDFTLLKKSTREIFYHEHLGRLDDPQYMADKLPRFDEFRRNGIFFGKNLIVTYETDNRPPDFQELKRAFAWTLLDKK